MKARLFSYSWLNNLLRILLVEGAWLALEETGLIAAGLGLVLEFVLHQQERYLREKEKRKAAARANEYALVESARFLVSGGKSSKPSADDARAR
ncbi:hypothetical protein [Pseudomaricurvus sp. HS19]|uniref:hypothetical protein n=1 Tax=Pseudomaricurvus sp. HS19 TaxID=2692626 RepID=UPI00136AFE84|nr:hypothetical protein [Pseudomaricurvus sp. HS19]MYM64494.1 hypothetical protein [Pseudomaricurvus sp. HS19]